MLWLVLTLRVESIMRKQIRRLSIKKLAHHLNEHVITIRHPKEIFTYAPDPRQIQMAQRKRKNLEDIMLTALS